MSDNLFADADPNSDFDPPFLLRHADIQNLVSSVGLRAAALYRRARQLHLQSQREIIDCGDGVRLTAELNLHRAADGLAILFHGWEGSSRSAYMVSAALALHEAGYSVVRLNFRDHGDSHHLNKGLFNSTLLEEVVNAVRVIQSRWPHRRNYLAGYSLGGNFALRLALAAPASELSLDHVAAISPVIDPARSLSALEEARFFYQRHFVGKWRKSLQAKLQCYPEYAYERELSGLASLRAMHDFFVPRFTAFAHRDDYFHAYAIRDEQLRKLAVATTIISSKDDPITRHHDLPSLSASDKLDIQLTERGAHCAFLQNFSLTSWIDSRLLALFS